GRSDSPPSTGLPYPRPRKHSDRQDTSLGLFWLLPDTPRTPGCPTQGWSEESALCSTARCVPAFSLASAVGSLPAAGGAPPGTASLVSSILLRRVIGARADHSA